ncbi:MAG: four helix bundle protein [Actinomycetota bacterium]|nr:four helix bundle protein [Actinomycetota bacterium]
MHDYRQLRVYDMAIGITSEPYRLTKTLPRSERYGLVQQMNRASVSIASNIAEGAGRGDSRDFARFLRIALGSACELEAQTTIAAGVGLVDGESARVLREHLERLKASITNLEKTISPP